MNPLPVLTGQTSGLKSVAGEWKLKIPVPFFLELHQRGEATLRVLTPEIMHLALIGVMTGNLSESAIEKQPRLVSETFREKVIAPLTTNSTDLGKWFKAFWREQENTRLARNEAWRTNLFIASRTQSEFIGGILTSPDPFPLFADSKYQAATNYFLPAISLQVSAFEEGALQFSYSNGKRAFRLSSDGVTARYHDPIQGDIELKPH